MDGRAGVVVGPDDRGFGGQGEMRNTEESRWCSGSQQIWIYNAVWIVTYER